MPDLDITVSCHRTVKEQVGHSPTTQDISRSKEQVGHSPTIESQVGHSPTTQGSSSPSLWMVITMDGKPSRNPHGCKDYSVHKSC